MEAKRCQGFGSSFWGSGIDWTRLRPGVDSIEAPSRREAGDISLFLRRNLMSCNATSSPDSCTDEFWLKFGEATGVALGEKRLAVAVKQTQEPNVTVVEHMAPKSPNK